MPQKSYPLVFYVFQPIPSFLQVFFLFRSIFLCLISLFYPRLQICLRYFYAYSFCTSLPMKLQPFLDLDDKINTNNIPFLRLIFCPPNCVLPNRNPFVTSTNTKTNKSRHSVTTQHPGTSENKTAWTIVNLRRNPRRGGMRGDYAPRNGPRINAEEAQ